MNVTRHTWEEIKDRYPGIFSQFFTEKLNPMDAPAIVFTGEDEEVGLVGFLSGYFHNLETFYIQRIGLSQSLRGKHLALQFIPEVVLYVGNEGVRYLMGAIENTNYPALVVALKAGFLITGVRVDTLRKLYVEMIKEI